MSLLQRNELTIYFSPAQVRLTHRQRTWRGVTGSSVDLACVSTGETPWAAPLSALESMLQSDQWTSGDVTIVLSNHYVRYLLIPWSGLISRRNEQANYVQHLFAETYGGLIDGHELRVSDTGFGRSRVASAIAVELLEKVRDVIHRNGLRLVSLQPYLMHAFNEHRRAVGKSDAWFVAVENGMLGIMGIAGDRWQLVRSVRCGDHWPKDLQFHLERFYLGGDAGMIPKIVHWCSPESRAETPAFTAPWRTHHLGAKAGMSNSSKTLLFSEAGNTA